MNKKFAILILTLLMSMTVVLAGCTSKQEPKDAMKSATGNAMKMTSYEMKSKVVIKDLKVTSADTENTAATEQVMSMLKNAELTVDGVYQNDPMQTELTMGINLKGDMSMSFNIPMVMTKEKLYVKIPSIPMLPIPEDVVGKYLVLDMKELAEQEGTKFNPDSMDTKKTQQLSNEIMNTLYGEYDGNKYFKDIKVKDANLPEGVDAKQVVQFYVTNENVKEAAEIFVNKAMPKILDIVAKDEYREMLGLTKEDIDKAKSDLNSANQDELSKGLNDLKNYLKINQFNVNTAIDKKDFPSYQDAVVNVEMNDPETKDNMMLSMQMTNQYSKVNEKQTFKIGIPKDSEVITMDELQKQMGSASY
ncbi:hypothetical protein J23TS9_59030 [Paenibacillus sp. J23TS9]|uniref:hypothetical protein n=1 Tax=Paenibacillus sp. J23TS9 TaxID=2807193 RepID=UPI001B289550|nr:hypothetical protein [Paenibacillus sp. J23TS9]GIP30773.1 hypothetical protein J23TS9_59030 [Paenibacillus sp. J23TS9]